MGLPTNLKGPLLREYRWKSFASGYLQPTNAKGSLQREYRRTFCASVHLQWRTYLKAVRKSTCKIRTKWCRYNLSIKDSSPLIVLSRSWIVETVIPWCRTAWIQLSSVDERLTLCYTVYTQSLFTKIVWCLSEFNIFTWFIPITRHWTFKHRFKPPHHFEFSSVESQGDKDPILDFFFF